MPPQRQPDRDEAAGLGIGHRNRWTAVAQTIARLPGRRLPINGWIQVTEMLHRRIVRTKAEIIYRTPYQVTMRLDLSDFVQRSIFYDAWECNELNLLVDVLRGADVVIDVGANVGLFTLVAANCVGASGQVHAFEPVPDNCERLLENLRLNAFKNVTLNRSAVGDHHGTVTLAIDTEMERTSGITTSGYFTVSEIKNPRRAVTADLDTIDSYLARTLGEHAVSLIKIDVEGAEPAVLRGMRATLASHRVDVVVLEASVYALSRTKSRIADLVEPLREANYTLYRLGLGGLLWRWSYHGEPSIPKRTPGPTGLLRGLYRGVRDLERLFNLVAIRDDHHALRDDPRLVWARSLGGQRRDKSP